MNVRRSFSSLGLVILVTWMPSCQKPAAPKENDSKKPSFDREAIAKHLRGRFRLEDRIPQRGDGLTDAHYGPIPESRKILDILMEIGAHVDANEKLVDREGRYIEFILYHEGGGEKDKDGARRPGWREFEAEELKHGRRVIIYKLQ